MLVTPPDVEQPHVRVTTPKLKEVTVAARPNLRDAESRDLDELLTVYGDFVAMNNNEGRTERMYHPYKYGRGQPICQIPMKFPLTKQAVVGEMPENIQRLGDIEESDSPLSSPVLIITKNEDIRYCV
jgi:hypothetical protein